MQLTASIINKQATRSRSTARNSQITAVIWVIMLLTINSPLFFGDIHSQFIFFPKAFAEGQWWLALTYPFVHLSWYHLLLDGLAFIILYLLFEDTRTSVLLLYCFAATLGSIWFSLLIEPAVYLQGLCGLSGVAHGLMAVSALQMIRYEDQRKIGILSLGLVVSKCIYELVTGHVLFEFLHMNLTGQPLAASHAGGVIGGLAGFIISNLLKKEKTGKDHCLLD